MQNLLWLCVYYCCVNILMVLSASVFQNPELSSNLSWNLLQSPRHILREPDRLRAIYIIIADYRTPDPIIILASLDHGVLWPIHDETRV